MADHYAVLGLAPYAEHSAVRAAYLELMRRYHPDINTSPEAAARAREVTAAYEVLGNPDSRIDYDLARAHAHAASAQRKSRGLRSPQSIAAFASVGAVGLLAFFAMQPAPEQRIEQAAQVAAASPEPPRAQSRPGARAQPARQAVRPAQAPPAPVEVARAPVPEKLVVELKRPAAVVDVMPKATPAAAPVRKVEPPRPVAQTRAPATKAAITKAPDLGALDRHLAMLFRQSVRDADAAKRQSLYRDHDRFVGRLNACTTAACKEREYLSRMGEVSTTMAARAKPR